MGKKGKAEEVFQYEIWLNTTGGWKRVEEDGNGGVFPNKQRALLIAQNKSDGEDMIETMVIERRPIAVFNGPAISVKHRMAAVERKKEADHGEVPGGSPQKDDASQGSPELGSEAPAGGRAGEGASAGPG